MTKIRTIKGSRRLILGGIFVAALIGLGIWLLFWETGSQSHGQVPSIDIEAHDEISFRLPDNEIPSYQQRAAAGDNEAANALASHYRQMHQWGDERRWLLVAANRGDCAAMTFLKEAATRNANVSERARWNDMLRQHACTWGRTYPEVSNPGLESLPLWDER